MKLEARIAWRSMVFGALVAAIAAAACGGGGSGSSRAAAEPDRPTLSEPDGPTLSEPGAATTAGTADDGALPAATPAARVATEFEAVAGSACACADADCAEGVYADFQNLVKRHRDTPSDDEAAQRTSSAVERLIECLGKWGITRERIWNFLQKI